MRFQTTISFEAPGVEMADVVTAAIESLFNQMKVKAAVGPAAEVTNEFVIVYTDGGCDSKKKVGAWAFTVQNGDAPIVEQSGAMVATTNNRMEMMAVIKALEHIEIGLPILIHCDSEYVIKGLTQWSENWVKNGWVNSLGKPVVNRDLWEHLLKLYSLHSVAFKHVKGHSGIAGNEKVDQMCTMEMLKAYATQHNPLEQPIPVDVKAKAA